MENINFTQFCIKNNLPCDNDMMFQAQLLGGRGLAGKISKRSIKSQDIQYSEMSIKNKYAHKLFYDGVKSGAIIDASGELLKDQIIKKENAFLNAEVQSKIKSYQSYIDFIKSMKTSYLKNGKLKKGYQLAVTDHENKINNLSNI